MSGIRLAFSNGAIVKGKAKPKTHTHEDATIAAIVLALRETYRLEPGLVEAQRLVAEKILRDTRARSVGVKR